MKNIWSYFRKWLSLSVATFLGLLAIQIGLPALLLFLQVSSFELNIGDLWILNWENEASGSGICFNLVPLLAIAIIVSLVGIFMKSLRKR
ncbi:hypothetical protein WA1_00390 [Scytonema hofmannii PCC 7110]|uniref:Uncharacterized protein n=1 Tax=Scytonema hofmannii PCC 7110 TaxID=128403 RepID=A0A139XG38_9CYAN|nr:hypothetical protein [Scytonema hofmannii]KYC43665.1 hypothetical protein WA1_00390 [Scytonema hofmannii PCC 7110]